MIEKASKPVRLSVVIVSFSQPRLLKKCLDALAAEVQDTDTQVLVVRRQAAMTEDEDGVAELRRQFSHFLWIAAPSDCTVPRLRMLGINSALAEITALLEDDCIVRPSWRSNLLASYTAGHKAVGGAVMPDDYETALDWAVFFCDYARFMPPFQGSQPSLPGNNLSYERSALAVLRENNGVADGLYEVFANSLLRRKGVELYANNDAGVTNMHRWTMANATSVPFHHGRAFAAMRFDKGAWGSRLLYSCATVLLPGLQTLRICRQVFARKRYRAQVLKASPLILLHWTCWSVGEFMGYLLGPGRSLEQWR
jgi:hypothetical protein